MTAEGILKKINQTRRYKLAGYINAHTDYEYYILDFKHDALPRSKDKDGQIVLAVKTKNPETVVTDAWRIVVDEVTYDDGPHSKATDRHHFFEHRCRVRLLEKVFDAAFPEEEREKPEKPEKAESAPEKPFAGWKGGRPKLSFSASDAQKILEMRKKGATIAEIAKEMHVGIRRVLRFLHSENQNKNDNEKKGK